jgi:hypothetical protein
VDFGEECLPIGILWRGCEKNYEGEKGILGNLILWHLLSQYALGSYGKTALWDLKKKGVRKKWNRLRLDPWEPKRPSTYPPDIMSQ